MSERARAALGAGDIARTAAASRAFPRAYRQLAAARLRREIDVQQRLDHPNVMPVIDADPDRKWFVMPLADGSLKDLWA